MLLSAAYGHDSEQPDNQVRCTPSLFSLTHSQHFVLDYIQYTVRLSVRNNMNSDICLSVTGTEHGVTCIIFAILTQ